MPIRKYQIARKAIDKTRLDDDAQVKVESQLILAKGPGASFSGNAGTTYSEMGGSHQRFAPDNYKNITKVQFVVYWNPITTAGGIRLYNASDGIAMTTVEPGITGWRWDIVDVTTTFKGLTAEKVIIVQTKGDGTSAPRFSTIYLRIVIDITS